jgi:hypothetical protein
VGELKTALTVNMTAVILDSFNWFEELPNGLYNMLLPVCAVFSVWENGARRSTEAV